MEDWTREALLNCRDPRVLFGEAIEDPKALRRAFAKLAKRFRPDEDAEASAHLRGLFEQARDGVAPEPMQAGPDAGESPPVLSPVDLLKQAEQRESLRIRNISVL